MQEKEICLFSKLSISGLLSNHAVAQFVEAMRYKAEGRGFDYRLCHWNFLLAYSFRTLCGPGVESISNSTLPPGIFLGSKGGRCVGLKTLPYSCADCPEIWEPKPPRTLRVCPGLYRDCFTYTNRKSMLGLIFIADKASNILV